MTDDQIPESKTYKYSIGGYVYWEIKDNARTDSYDVVHKNVGKFKVTATQEFLGVMPDEMKPIDGKLFYEFNDVNTVSQFSTQGKRFAKIGARIAWYPQNPHYHQDTIDLEGIPIYDNSGVHGHMNGSFIEKLPDDLKPDVVVISVVLPDDAI